MVDKVTSANTKVRYTLCGQKTSFTYNDKENLEYYQLRRSINTEANEQMSK